MNEITRIHLASIPFNVEVEAKKALEKYLANIEKSLVADKDTMREIEARIAEILNERGIVGEKVITNDDITFVTQQLGAPTEFIDETALDSERASIKSSRKLYRDSDNAMLAGVCSGVAAYFKTDATFIRLAAVILLFVTAGAMIPVYIVLAIVMPPAKTAAQKLQMAGEPVTLESLKEQTSLSSYNKNQKMLIRILTIIAGIGFTVVAAVSMVGLSVAVIEQYGYVFSQDWPMVALAFALGTAGVLFIALCVLLAYASFAMKFTKRIGISLAVIIVIGLLLGASGGLGIRYQADSDYAKNYIERSLDTTKLKNINRLVLDSDSPVHVEYIATDSVVAMSANYNYMKNRIPTQRSIDVKLQANNNVLSVDTASYDNACQQQRGECGQLVTIVITGPVLEMIELSKGNSLNYQVDAGQPKLEVIQQGVTSNLTLESNRPIMSLTASIGGGVTLNASQANIFDATVNVSDNMSGVDLARVKTLSLNIPESCAQAEDQNSLNVLGARTITINGTAYHEDTEYPCAVISVGDSDGWSD